MCLNVFLGGGFHLEALESVLGLGNSNVGSVSHVCISFAYLRSVYRRPTPTAEIQAFPYAVH